MITIERLNELIKQGATIYAECWGKVKKLNLNDLECMEVEDNDVYYEIEDNTARTTDLKHLFETKEEAEWHKEFGNITRTERLELPTWEEIEKDFESINKFGTYPVIDVNGLYMDIFVDNYSIKFIVMTGQSRMLLTKENYTLACRKCKELFLGDDNEKI